MHCISASYETCQRSLRANTERLQCSQIRTSEIVTRRPNDALCRNGHQPVTCVATGQIRGFSLPVRDVLRCSLESPTIERQRKYET